MLAEARCGGFVCAHRHGKVELVVHGLDSHHWLLDTEPLLGVRVGGWHLLVRYHLEHRLQHCEIEAVAIWNSRRKTLSWST